MGIFETIRCFWAYWRLVTKIGKISAAVDVWNNEVISTYPKGNAKWSVEQVVDAQLRFADFAGMYNAAYKVIQVLQMTYSKLSDKSKRTQFVHLKKHMTKLSKINELITSKAAQHDSQELDRHYSEAMHLRGM